MLRDKKINKTYWAIVKNHPKKEKDTLINFLRKILKTINLQLIPKKLTAVKKPFFIINY